MKEADLKYYKRYNVMMASCRFTWRIMWSRSKLRKLSWVNRQKDYLALVNQPELFQLHQTINEILVESAKEWPHYDYGEGYFYQSFDQVGIRGYRDTTYRINAYKLEQVVRGRTVLDIGANAGFISLSIASVATHVTGMEINPYLIGIGNTVAKYLGIKNVTLLAEKFEDFKMSETYDVILSFANHSTYDSQTKQNVQDYFEKCKKLLKPDGTLLFESHAPDYEGDKLTGVLNILDSLFEVEESRVLEGGSFLDKGRTFIKAKLRP